MPMQERIRRLHEDREVMTTIPTSRLQEVLARSRVETAVQQLSSLDEVEVQKEVIEQGRKMVIVVKWPPESQECKRLVISVREESLAFIGDHESGQYLSIEGVDVYDRALVEEYLALTFVNPQHFVA